MTTTEFIDWLQINDKVIVRKVQIYPFVYYPTWSKYNKNYEKNCQFDFPRPLVAILYIDYNGIIKLRQNNS